MSKKRWVAWVGGSLAGLMAVTAATVSMVATTLQPASAATTAAAASETTSRDSTASQRQHVDLGDDRLGSRAIGRTAVDFTVLDLDREILLRDDFRGEPFVLVFAGAQCRWSGRTVERLMSALEDFEPMRAVVVVFQPRRNNEAAPNPVVAARTFAQRHVVGKRASEQTHVGTSETEIRQHYGSLVFDRPNAELTDLPALFAVDGGGIIRAALVGDAAADEVAEALAAAAQRDDDDE